MSVVAHVSSLASRVCRPLSICANTTSFPFAVLLFSTHWISVFELPSFPPGSDSSDMNNKAVTFGMHPSFAGNSRAYSQVPASYRNNADPLRRQMSTGGFFGFDDSARFLGSADTLGFAEMKPSINSNEHHVTQATIKMDPHPMYAVSHPCGGGRLQSTGHHSMDGGGHPSMDFYHDGLTAFATQSLSGFSTDHTGVSNLESKPRAIITPEYTVCFASFLAKIK
ncbi:hypothetical protein RvY_09743-2 [Ramazzottius varieornatus]|uniref:Uncharacterized protein n=1 Tax=Ramazzottius varieornatus TaxID=947166 RepID=A0A1D1VCJ2_RAMVA|nr:hypothetical protein RvY_09743-2 [Ramazzottius varieornatus]